MPATPHLETASQVLTLLLQELSAKVPFIILRNYEALPIDWGNDVDILIQPTHMLQVKKIVSLFIRSKVGRNKFQTMTRLNFWSVRVHCSDRILIVDFMEAITRRWFVYVNTDVIFKNKRNFNGLFYVPDISHEMLLIVAKELFAYGYIRSRYHAKIRQCNLPEIHASASSLFSGRLTKSGIDLVVRAMHYPEIKGRPEVNKKLVMNLLSISTWLAFKLSGVKCVR